MQLSEAIELYCQRMGITIADLTGNSRKVPLPTYRHIFWMMCSANGIPLQELSVMFGLTTHGILEGIKKADTLLLVKDKIAIRCYEKWNVQQ